MSWLLDTCALSEKLQKRPDKGILTGGPGRSASGSECAAHRRAASDDTTGSIEPAIRGLQTLDLAKRMTSKENSML